MNLKLGRNTKYPGWSMIFIFQAEGLVTLGENSSTWEKNWFELIDQIWQHNQSSEEKKYFFLCMP